MSGKIKLNSASGGGSVSIQAPSSESNNRTLTLPSDADGTIVSKDTTNNLANIASINGGSIGTKNLVTNGAFLVSQRGTSSTSSGYQTLDRFAVYVTNVGTTVTQSQQDLSSSDTPYSLGFRKSHRTALSGAGTANANSEIIILQKIEAQDIATSGWNYTSTSSYVTLQFWFKCSTNQTFYCYLETKDGTSQTYPFSFTASGNNTWTKITKTIPGNSNLQFDNNNGEGLLLVLVPFYGTDKTNNSKSLNQWSAFDTTARTPDYASTWLTAGASTFDITGVQLEVGSVATDFEHRSFGQELALCQRYAFVIPYGGNSGTGEFIVGTPTYARLGNAVRTTVNFPVPMRANPTFTGSATNINYSSVNSSANFLANTVGVENANSHFNVTAIQLRADNLSSMDLNTSGTLSWQATGGFFKFESEL